MKLRTVSLAAAALLAVLSSGAQAAATGTYFLHETFNYPATVDGSFFYNDANHSVTAINLVVNDVNGAAVLDTNWNTVNGANLFANGGTVETLFLDAGHQTNNYSLGIFLTFETSGATLSLTENGGYWGTNSLYDWRNGNYYHVGQLQDDRYVAGSSSLKMGAAVPEPGTWALAGLALIGAGVAKRRRR